MSEKRHIINMSQKPTRKVRIEGKDNHQTSQSGLISICKYLENIGFKKQFNMELNKYTNRNSKCSYCEVFLLTILAIASGAESMESVVLLGHDSVLRKILSWIYIPCATTLGRIYKRFNNQDI